MENAIHGFFLLMGLVTVGCVLLISVYLVVSGIPAIREIGLMKFLFGPVWNSNAAEPQFGICPLSLPVFTVLRARSCWACPWAI